MRRRLPPLSTLLAFEAVAELGSFSRAGEALALTHSAVSHQIKQLEDHVGVRLLQRLPRKVLLTPEGALYLAEVQTALKLLEAADASIRQYSMARPLRISVLSSFAGNFLIPELSAFMEQHASVRVEIDATAGIENDESANVDVFIRYGKGEWPAFESVKLMDVELFPVCSPAYLAKQGPVAQVSDLSRLVLLRHTKEPWDSWLDAAEPALGGSASAILPAGPMYTDARLMLDAACDGQGVALARSVLADADLRGGRLVKLFDFHVASSQGYYAFFRVGALSRPSIKLFVDWLIEVCKRLQRCGSDLRSREG